ASPIRVPTGRLPIRGGAGGGAPPWRGGARPARRAGRPDPRAAPAAAGRPRRAGRPPPRAPRAPPRRRGGRRRRGGPRRRGGVREAARHVAGEVPVTAPVAAAAALCKPGLGPAQVVVVDDAPAWAAAAGEGRQVTVMPAGDAALESLGGTSLTCVVVNLAARAALAALATLREAGSSARIWGCLATPGAGRALPLGPVEPVARPVDPDAVLATFRRHAARNARVLAAGADADALISLRQALVREGMSVAMAWDGARAVELLDAHRPEIVVIDLALA